MMGKPMTVTWPITKKELTSALKNERNPFTLRRLQAIRMIFDHSVPQAATLLGISERTLRSWLVKFNQIGPDALINKPRPGQPTRLKPEMVDCFKQRICGGARPQDNVCSLRAKDIRRILVSEFGADYSLNGVYFLLHRLGFSSLVPRPYHPKADKSAQENFKKTSYRKR